MSKFNNKKTVMFGIKFDSQAEANRYLELKALQESGLIRNLTLQPIFLLLPNFTTQNESGKKFKVRPTTYIADFSYIEGEKQIVEDVKGIQTEVFKIKSKWFMFSNPNLVLRISKANRKGFVLEDRQYAKS